MTNMIGMVVPLAGEAKYITCRMRSCTRENISGRIFYHGKIGENKVVLAISGIGKEKSFEATCDLISRFSPEYLIHFGSAGALNPDIKIGDLVLGTKIINHQKNEETNTDSELNKKIIKFAESRHIDNLYSGIIVSVNEDVVTKENREELFSLYLGLSVDLETYGVVSASCSLNIPCVVIRAVVDLAWENTYDEFSKNVDCVLNGAGLFIYNVIKSEYLG